MTTEIKIVLTAAVATIIALYVNDQFLNKA